VGTAGRAGHAASPGVLALRPAWQALARSTGYPVDLLHAAGFSPGQRPKDVRRAIRSVIGVAGPEARSAVAHLAFCKAILRGAFGPGQRIAGRPPAAQQVDDQERAALRRARIDATARAHAALAQRAAAAGIAVDLRVQAEARVAGVGLDVYARSKGLDLARIFPAAR
jgi:hypothetical protein